MTKAFFTKRFITGVVLIILNFVLGKITTFTMILYYNNKSIFWLSIIGYVVSWLMLFAGLYLCGREGYNYAKELYKEYISYKENVRRIRYTAKKGIQSFKRTSDSMIYEPSDDSYLLQKHIHKYSHGDVLDMGSGSGILAFEAAETADFVIAADISDYAVRYIKKQIKEKGLKNVKAMKTDLFSNIKGRFDLIIFNPPYLPMDKREPEPSRVHTTGGKKGYELIVKFINELESHLKDNGKALIIFSDLTSKEKVDEAIFNNCLEFEIIDKQKLFFERLFVYLIKRSKLLEELERKAVSGVKYYSKGKRGYVYSAFYKGERVAVKHLRSDTKAKDVISKEASNLMILNKKNIGPRLIMYNEDYIVTEFIEGDTFLEYVSKHDRKEIVKVMLDILRQCSLMDDLHISKEELTRPFKDLIIKNDKPVFLDFERCHKTDKPQNITQIFQFFLSIKVALELGKKGIKLNQLRIRRLLQKYKKAGEDEKKSIRKLLVKSIQGPD